MKIKFKILSLFILISIGTLTAQNTAFDQIKEDLRSGKISNDEAILQKFYLGFNSAKANIKYRTLPNNFRKCGTDFIIEYNRSKTNLSQQTIDEIESVINPSNLFTITANTYTSPGSKFEISYETAGTNAVPTQDVNTNGIPDYVEKVAEYFDYSWRKLIDTMGYSAPPIGTGKYKVSFESMDYYGYTNVYSSTPKLTYIVMHNNFLGFPANTDPEGNQLGAAKVTAFHEFKHALQIVYNNWNDPGWFLEMDATWAEDIGFDKVNDYYNYLSSSHILEPGRSFESGDGYEDCLWMHYLSQSFGNQINRAIWNRRAVNGFEDIYLCFNNILLNNSSTFEKALTEYFSWNYLTGDNSVNDIPGYEEAKNYPSPKICKNINSLPATFSGCTREKLSASFLEIVPDKITRNIYIDFQSSNSLNNFAVITKKSDGTNQVDLLYSSSNTINYLTNILSTDISKISFIPVCISKGTLNYSYEITTDFLYPAKFTHTQLKDTENTGERIVKTLLETPFNIASKDSLKIFYRKNNDNFVGTKMSPTGNPNEFSSVIPDFGNEVEVNYYFRTSDTNGNYFYYPETAPDTSFGYYVGLDKFAPTISMFEINDEKSIFNFPVEFFAHIEDNIEVEQASVEIEYKNTISSIGMTKVGENLFYASVDILQNEALVGEKLYYRIVANDISQSKNSATFPSSGSNSVSLVEGFEFSSKPNLTITDNNIISIRDTISIDQDLVIGDIDVYLDVTHDRPSDLEFRLKNPLGSTSYIVSRPGLNDNLSAKNFSVVLDDEAYWDFDNIFLLDPNVFDGRFLPSNLNLQTLNGINAKGKWILLAYDKATGYQGVINEWGLIIRPQKTVDVSNDDMLPNNFSIQNYPNPFNPTTTISFSLAEKSNVSLKIFNSIGQLVETLIPNRVLEKGTHNIVFDASGFASGIYFCTINSEKFNKSIKLMLLK
ncbi:MAG: hypothetical protein Fur0015_04160 [Ignavibacteriales bacterium]